MTNNYETVFILTPVLSEVQMKEAVNKYVKLIKGKGGKVVHEENWGLRKLAYPIQKKSTGFYYLLQYEAEGDIVEHLELNFRRDETVIRFLTVKMEKYSVIYADKKRNMNKKAKEEK